MPAAARLVDAIHRGLSRAWAVFSIRAVDTPARLPKPEYVCTVTVAEQIVTEALKDSAGAIVRMEENVQKLAASCLALPSFPRLHPLPSIPPRKIGKRGDRERVDIAIHDTKAGLQPVGRAVVELKISDGAGGLHADLKRNQQLMGLCRVGRDNQLDAAALGFVVVDEVSKDQAAGRAMVAALAARYEQLAKGYLSPRYVTEVSLRQVSMPPEDDDDEFVHIISVVIAFVRPLSAIGAGPHGMTRFWSDSSDHNTVQMRTYGDKVQ